jgi:hypothetical protein
MKAFRYLILGFGTTVLLPQALPAQNPSRVPTNACELFTLEEIGTIIGRANLRKGTNDQGMPAICRYRSSTEGITIALEQDASAANFRDMRELRSAAGERVETISNLGVEAFLIETQLYTRKGRYNLNIRIGDNPNAKNREEILKLARAGLAKLP